LVAAELASERSIEADRLFFCRLQPIATDSNGQFSADYCYEARRSTGWPSGVQLRGKPPKNAPEQCTRITTLHSNGSLTAAYAVLLAPTRTLKAIIYAHCSQRNKTGTQPA
jgi:hypothetical protein